MTMKLAVTAMTLLAMGVLHACGLGSPPIPFATGEDIPLGEQLTLEVTGWEEVPALHAPLSSLRAAAGEKAIVTFVRWQRLEPGGTSSDLERAIFLERFLTNRLAVVDSEGFETEAFDAMPRPWYLFNVNPVTGVHREWAVVFHVWVDSEDYSLLIEHPDPGSGDFRVAIVELP